MFQALSVEMLGTAHVEMEHGIYHPFPLVIGDGKAVEQFLTTLEIDLQGRGEERLAESARTTQKDVPHAFLSEVHDIFGLVHIEIPILANRREVLYSHGIFVGLPKFGVMNISLCKST